MNHSTPTNKMSKAELLSTLWIWVTANYIFCDVVSLMNPPDLKNFLTGKVGTLVIDEKFLLGASIMMEIPFAMILLSRILPYPAVRWANLIAGAVMTMIQVGSFFAGTPSTLHYWFFSVIEILGTLIIVWQAWKWSRQTQRELQEA